MLFLCTEYGQLHPNDPNDGCPQAVETETDDEPIRVVCQLPPPMERMPYGFWNPKPGPTFR